MENERIEKKVMLKAPRSKVWKALTDSTEFGTWFGAKMEGSFAAGKKTTGKILSKNYEHLQLQLDVEKIEPETYFSYRWHPFAVDAKVDYSSETPTLVEFRLEEVAGGTMLSVTESGFGKVPPGRRAEAFRMNNDGWGAQLKNIEKHVS